MKKESPQDKYISVKEASKILGIGVSTCWLWMKSKPEFPKPVRSGKSHTRWDLKEINGFATDLTNPRPAIHRQKEKRVSH
jgi:predicted DNA-binding transcriptional regulator AlpA